MMLHDRGDGRKGPTYSELNQSLLRSLPALQPGYQELRRLWNGEEPGPHVVYGDVLVPYLIDKLLHEPECAGIASAFELLEELLLTEDSDVRDVVGASVLEGLNGVPEARARARPHMGSRTRRLAAEIEDAWG